MAMNATLTLPAPAKVNYFLHVTGQRDDGYHTLETLFVLVDSPKNARFLSADESPTTTRFFPFGLKR